MKSLLLGLLAAGALLAASGCATAPKPMSVAYAPAGPAAAAPKTATLVVCKPEEARPLGGKSDPRPGFLVFIPLFPYAHQQFTPDRIPQAPRRPQYDFLKDLGETVAKDLTASGLAGTVLFTEETGADADAAYPDACVLHLRLKEGIWHRNITTYGTSFLGIYPWLCGAPVSYGHAELAVEADLRHTGRPPAPARTFTGRVDVTEWLYVRGFPECLPAAYGQISGPLRAFVGDTLDGKPPKPAADTAPAPAPAPAEPKLPDAIPAAPAPVG